MAPACATPPRPTRMLIVARREVSESLSGSENGARQELLPPTQASYGTAAAAVDALDRVAGMIKKAVYRSSPGPAGAAGRRHHAAMHTVVRNAARGSRHVTHVGLIARPRMPSAGRSERTRTVDLAPGASGRPGRYVPADSSLPR
jgi:hypothetical protein